MCNLNANINRSVTMDRRRVGEREKKWMKWKKADGWWLTCTKHCCCCCRLLLFQWIRSSKWKGINLDSKECGLAKQCFLDQFPTLFLNQTKPKCNVINWNIYSNYFLSSFLVWSMGRQTWDNGRKNKWRKLQIANNLLFTFFFALLFL